MGIPVGKENIEKIWKEQIIIISYDDMTRGRDYDYASYEHLFFSLIYLYLYLYVCMYFYIYHTHTYIFILGIIFLCFSSYSIHTM